MDEPHICGRCGYDLTGVIESWGTAETAAEGSSCPVEGVCSECGWAFAWREVFHPAQTHSRWFIEHAPSWLGVIRRTPSTLVRVLLPWWFWSGLSMNAPVRLWRAVVWWVLLSILIHVAANGLELRANWNQHVTRLNRGGWTLDASQFTTSDLAAAGTNLVLRPAARLRITSAPLYALDPSGQMSMSGKFRLSVVSIFSVFQVPPFLAAGLACAFTFPAIFVVLPIVRRRAEVRWAHLARAAVYGVGLAMLVSQTARVLTYEAREDDYSHQVWMMMLIALAVSAWWSCAIVIGWRVKRAWLLLPLLWVLAGVVSISVAMVFDLSFFDTRWGPL